MTIPNNRRSVNVGNNVFENLYVYGDCKFDKDVTINGQLKYDELTVKNLFVENSFSFKTNASLYIGDGFLAFENTLNNSNGYYITTSVNALNAGPVTLNSTMTIDGTWVIV